MAEHGLHASDICAVHEQVRCKGMTKCVWRHVLRDAGFDAVTMDKPFDGSWRDGTDFRGSGPCTIVTNKEERTLVIPHIQIFLHMMTCLMRKKYDAHLISFAADRKFITVEIDGIFFERRKL